MENTTKSKAGHLGAGVVIGILLAGTGLSLTQDSWMPAPVTTTKVVTKTNTVTKIVPIEKVVTKLVPAPVKEVSNQPSVWKATVKDENGNVTEYLVKKVKYIIVGAVLTDLNGKEIEVGADELKVERVQ